jgi:cytochrome c556
MSLTDRTSRSRKWTGGALLAACSLVLNCAASGQERTAAAPKEVIFARKILMDTINNNMDEIEGMIGAGKDVDLAEAREHADTISVMLMAFPHLFPESTDQWKPNVERDPGTDTYASPDVWSNYADFYKKAADASKIAYKASRAKEQAEFKTFVAALRQACDNCHAAYQKGD